MDTWVEELDALPASVSKHGLQDFIEKVSIFQTITKKSIVTDKVCVL